MTRRHRTLLAGGAAFGACAVAALLALAPAGPALAQQARDPVVDAGQPGGRSVGQLELVATFDGPMPTGVAVSRAGRVFVNFPRWVDAVQYTVAEVKGGETVPFPDRATNDYRPDAPEAALVSVQSVVVDPADRLWMLDTGTILQGPVAVGGAKMLAVDLTTDKVVRTISFPRDVALPTTYLNDVRFDLRRGADGVAYITDSSGVGPNAIIVVDLATGQSRRRLNDHPSTKPDGKVVPLVEGKPVLEQQPTGRPAPVKFGADGIAISADGERLFYRPISSRRLYSVATDALADPAMSDAQVAATVVDHGRTAITDGMESDARGRLYLTDVENNAVRRLTPPRQGSGRSARGEVLASDPRLLWPDTLAVGADGYLYVTANQLHRQPQFNNGRDLRQKPYMLFRTPVDAGPVSLTR